MICLQRRLKCKFIGSSEYQPADIPDNYFIPVVGYETRTRKQEKNGKTITVEDLYYLVVTSKSKLISIASFNCATMIDYEDEKHNSNPAH